MQKSGARLHGPTGMNVTIHREHALPGEAAINLLALIRGTPPPRTMRPRALSVSGTMLVRYPRPGSPHV